jgi:hypothetical protein
VKAHFSIRQESGSWLTNDVKSKDHVDFNVNDQEGVVAGLAVSTHRGVINVIVVPVAGFITIKQDETKCQSDLATCRSST